MGKTKCQSPFLFPSPLGVFAFRFPPPVLHRPVIRRHPALVLVCALVVPHLFAAPPAATDFTAPKGMEFTDKQWIAHGPATFRDGDTVFAADEFIYYVVT